MGACALNVSGLSFAVDEFLKTSSLKPQAVYHRGEIPPLNRQPRPDTGFILTVSDDDNEPLSIHLTKAIRFLSVRADELKRAAQSGAEDLRLILMFNDSDLFAHTAYLPPKLLLLAAQLGLGIEMTCVKSRPG